MNLIMKHYIGQQRKKQMTRELEERLDKYHSKHHKWR